MNKFFVSAIAGLSLMVSACGPQTPYQQTAAACVDGQGNPADCVNSVAQQGGSFISEHPIATAAMVGAGAYALGKRNERRAGYSGYGYNRPRVIRQTVVHRVVRPSYSGYGYNRPRVIRQTVVHRVVRPSYSGYSSYSRPAYRTVTRTTTYRRR